MLAGLVIGTLLLALPLGAYGSSDAIVDRGEVAKALELRSKLGLNTDPDLVVRSLSDPAYDRTPWGIRLSADEIAEMDTRAEARRTFAPAVSMALAEADSAGVSIDQRRGGIPVFLTTGDGSELAEHVAQLLPLGTAFEVRNVELTLSELSDLQSLIVEQREVLRQVDIDVQTVGIDESANAITVGVRGLTEGTTNALASTYGSNVLVEEAPRVQGGDACNSRADCLPIKGGLRMYRAGFPNEATCTTAMVVREYLTTTYYMLTAGHCIDLNGDLDVDWKHASTVWGTAKYESWEDNAIADVGLIRIQSADVPSTKNEFYHASASDVRQFFDYEEGATQLIGDQACRSGAKSGYDCGLIDLRNVLRDVDGNDIQHQWQVDFDSCPGDSGAPVYRIDTIYGTFSDSTAQCNPSGEVHGWYTPMDWALAKLSNAGWDVVLCLQWNCP